MIKFNYEIRDVHNKTIERVHGEVSDKGSFTIYIHDTKQRKADSIMIEWEGPNGHNS